MSSFNPRKKLPMDLSNTGFSIAAVLTGLVAVALHIYWMVLGWRGLRALERISDTLRDRRDGPVA
jgi:hypothetical protein